MKPATPDAATLSAALRHFPLVGRPRPACPALPARIREVVNAADAARQQGDRGMADAAHALNKAALIASDAGLTDLAHQLCWQHINIYRTAGPATSSSGPRRERGGGNYYCGIAGKGLSAA